MRVSFFHVSLRTTVVVARRGSCGVCRAVVLALDLSSFVASESLASGSRSTCLFPSSSLTSIVTTSSLKTTLHHVGWANVGRWTLIPRPLISILHPSRGVHAIRRKDRYPIRWIDTPVRIRRTARKTKDDRYRRTRQPKKKVGLRRAIMKRHLRASPTKMTATKQSATSGEKWRGILTYISCLWKRYHAFTWSDFFN